MNLTSFFQNPIVNLISFVIGIIGLLGTLITFKSYKSQQKMEDGYKYILSEAKRSWKGKYTEEQIKELTTQFHLLEEQIRKDVPNQAKKAILENQLNYLSSSIGELYEQYCNIKTEISKIKECQNVLDDNIRNSIENEIMPTHTHKQKQSRNLVYMVYAILIFTVVPMVLSFLHDTLLFNTLLYVIVIIMLFIFIKPLEFKIDAVILRNKLIYYTSITLLFICWISLLFYVMYEPNYINGLIETTLTIFSLIPFSIFAHLLSISKNAKKTIIKNAINDEI